MTPHGYHDEAIRRIAEARRMKPEEVLAYVTSIGRQIGAADAGAVAEAVAHLVGQGKPFKAKDVAKIVSLGVAGLTGEAGAQAPSIGPVRHPEGRTRTIRQSPCRSPTPRAGATRASGSSSGRRTRSARRTSSRPSTASRWRRWPRPRAWSRRWGSHRSRWPADRCSRGVLFSNGAERLIPETGGARGPSEGATRSSATSG